MASFELSDLALKAVCPNNALKLDDQGMPSVMVWVPNMRLCDVLNTEDTSCLPAFRVNGSEIDGFWFGKYQTHHYNGRAYSLPGEDPSASATLDTFVSYNNAKVQDGMNWHEATNAEWAAIALYCHKYGLEPYGNNNYGKDTRETLYKAIPTYISSSDESAGYHTDRVATGTGPITWSHDGTLEGIWDMNGNVWEWTTGLRLVYGELQIIKDNNASDPSCDLSATSAEWMAIDASTGDLITPNGSGTTSGSVKLDYVSNKWTYSTSISNTTGSYGCTFANVTCDTTIGDDAKLLLQSLAMLPDLTLTGDDIDTTYGNDYFYANNAEAERCQFRGGRWDGGASAGVFSSYLDHARSATYTSIGGRSALIED
ncbi:MAG: hypothetical protein LUD12_10115 [Lachnospiraceae bacterium]|nr:hypothetical protein [Lachnospiraceae bacterium]